MKRKIASNSCEELEAISVNICMYSRSLYQKGIIWTI